MMPPSPRLLARSTSVTYLSETTIISAQKIAETPPMMFSVVSGMPCCGIEGLLGRVQRARADVAVDDAQREQREAGDSLPPRRRLVLHCGSWQRFDDRVHSDRLDHRGILRTDRGEFLRQIYGSDALQSWREPKTAMDRLRVGGGRRAGLHAGRIRDASAIRPRQRRDGLPARRGDRRAALLARARDHRVGPLRGWRSIFCSFRRKAPSPSTTFSTC